MHTVRRNNSPTLCQTSSGISALKRFGDLDKASLSLSLFLQFVCPYIRLSVCLFGVVFTHNSGQTQNFVYSKRGVLKKKKKKKKKRKKKKKKKKKTKMRTTT